MAQLGIRDFGYLLRYCVGLKAALHNHPVMYEDRRALCSRVASHYSLPATRTLLFDSAVPCTWDRSETMNILDSMPLSVLPLVLTRRRRYSLFMRVCTHSRGLIARWAS